MAKISSGDFQGLQGNVDNIKEKGICKSVFICGKFRKGQQVGKMYCMKPDVDFDKVSGPDDYIIYEKDSIYILLTYIRKVRAKYDKVKTAKGDRDVLTYFNYSPSSNEKYPEGAKIEYIFAGMVFDLDKKEIMKDEEGNPHFVYFRNKGVKCGAAFEFVNAIVEKTNELTPLSDDPEFEKLGVTPRRFITKVSVGANEHPEYGTQLKFDYELFKQIPDDTAIDVINKSKKWMKEFDKQFDATNNISKGGNRSFTKSSSELGNPSFEDTDDKDDAQDKLSKELKNDLKLPDVGGI